MAGILARYHEQVGKLERISTEGGRAFAVTADGTLIVPAAVEVVPWTEAVDKASRRPEYDHERREVALSGRMTERARKELEDRGWEIREVKP
jgi:hypothetical protein